MAQKIDSIKQLSVPGASNWAVVGGMQYCWGFNNVASGGTTITFPRAFASTPAVVCTTQDLNEQTAWVSARTATTVQLKQKYTGANLGVSWIAIGPAS